MCNLGFDKAAGYPLLSAIFGRRSRRIMKGIERVPAIGIDGKTVNTLDYKSNQKPEPLSELEEALLIAVTGVSGYTFTDRPFSPSFASTPNLTMVGRTASSPDNCQSTHFFLINDEGTYYLRRPRDFEKEYEDCSAKGLPDPADLIARARQAKVKISDQRLFGPSDKKREFPVFFGSNKLVSNLPGSTILLPVLDMTEQYINILMYLLSHEPETRPSFVDDWRIGFPYAGVRKWVRNGTLRSKYDSRSLPIPLGKTGLFRTDVETALLIQNILLTLQAMGLGGWVHGCPPSPYMLGYPNERFRRHDAEGQEGGLGFEYVKPKFGVFRWLRRFTTPLGIYSQQPVKLEFDGTDSQGNRERVELVGLCPPNYSIRDAVHKVFNHKFVDRNGVYVDSTFFECFHKEQSNIDAYLSSVPIYTHETRDIVVDIGEYIYRTYGRFPAHIDAFVVPGVWVQAHHLDLEYYDFLFQGGYLTTHAEHDSLWH